MPILARKIIALATGWSHETLGWLTVYRELRRFAPGIVAAVAMVTSGAYVADALAQAPPPLTLVSTAWAPFTNDAGKPRFALDLVEAALDRIKRTAKTTIVPPAEFTTALISGPFDGSAAAWKDPERERFLLFSQPYLENRLVLVGRRGADVSAKSLAALKGKRVALVAGYSYGDAVDKSGAVFVRAAAEEEGLSLLLKQAVDYALMDDLVVDYIFKNHPKESATRLQVGTTPLVTRELYLAIRRSRPDAEAIIKAFNAELRGMIADRTYHRLLHVDWLGADVDGDGVPEYVPANDSPGPAEPQRVYTLFSSPSNQGLTINPQAQPEAPKDKKPGFYIGGSIYSDWASVPQNYKNPGSGPYTPGRSTASIFSFSW